MWPAILSMVVPLLDKLIPDREAADKAKLELFRLAQAGEFKAIEALQAINVAQAATNTAEAQAGPFRGGWRPYLGWVCGFGLTYQYLVRPLVPWCLKVAGIDAPPMPALETGEIIGLVTGMLGLAGLRSMDKRAGGS